MKLFYLLVPALLVSLLLPAQNKYFVKGKIVTNAGDTISGFIERLRDDMLSDSIHFKNKMDSQKPQNFTPDSLSAFIFPDENRVYEPVAYEETKNGIIIHEKKFANLLLKGYCSLYILYLRDKDVHILFEPENDHIFLAKKSDTVTVLKESESMVNNVYHFDKKYIYPLTKLFDDCPAIDSASIAQTGFYRKAMVSIFTKYNLCRKPDVMPITFKTKEKTKITGTVYAGYAFFDSKVIQSTSGITLGLFFNILHSRINERIALSLGINFKNLKYSIFNSSNNFRETASLNLIGLPIKGAYYFGKGKITPFLDFGFIPSLAKLNYTDSSGQGVIKGYTFFASVGPGVNIGPLYLSALVEFSGSTIISKGPYYSFRIGYRF